MCHTFLISHAIALRGGSAPAPEDLVSHLALPQRCPTCSFQMFCRQLRWVQFVSASADKARLVIRMAGSGPSIPRLALARSRFCILATLATQAHRREGQGLIPSHALPPQIVTGTSQSLKDTQHVAISKDSGKEENYRSIPASPFLWLLTCEDVAVSARSRSDNSCQNFRPNPPIPVTFNALES